MSLKVAWVGLRGLPGVQGGVETHAEQLCPRLHTLGCDMTVLGRLPYQRAQAGTIWRGVHLRPLWAPRHKHLEAVVHTFLAILHAGLVSRPDVLHIQAIGPGLWTPLARLLGLRVVVTHHGADYERQKWGPLARWVLRQGEALATHWAHELIVISRTIQADVAMRHGRQGACIPNGMTPPSAPADPALLAEFGLRPQRYLLLVSRLVPEKRHLDLINAFGRARSQGLLQGWNLALVGAADHADAYARQVADAAARTPGVVMTGFQTGAALQALLAHAGVFVLPSSHEGLPIALLEALAWGITPLASDIPPHRELRLTQDSYFALGDVAALSASLVRLADRVEHHEGPAERLERMQEAARRFDWDDSARQTRAVYERVGGLASTKGGCPTVISIRPHESERAPDHGAGLDASPQPTRRASDAVTSAPAPRLRRHMPRGGVDGTVGGGKDRLRMLQADLDHLAEAPPLQHPYP
ncbi:MAG: glycosyltransferase family 4 protein [Betaproteobacteria bacterium]